MAKKLRDEDLILNIIVNGNKGQKEMEELEKAIKGTNKEITQLQKKQKAMLADGKNETAAYKAITAAIKDKNASILLAENRLKELRKGMKITEMTSGDLKKELKDLNKWMDHTKPDTEAYKAYEERLKAVKERLSELKPVAEDTGFNLKEMANKFNHYIGVITAGIVTFVGIISGLKQINETFAEFDDKVADVQKTTGLAKDEVRELNEEFKKIDTRTQQEDLLGLAQVAGKLGIEGRDDILGFVKAADQISVALSEDLGGDVEESINEIGKLVEIFSLKEEFGLENSILKIGSTINDLGASSSANEGYLVEFTKRVAGVAPAAKISIQNIMGIAATLDQLGQTAEVSGTAFNDVIPSMFKDTATFAGIAGMEVGKFAELLNTDANAALIKVLEGVKGNNASFGEMVARLDSIGIDGSRATTVLSALAGKVDVLKEQQLAANSAFEVGNSITNEYNIKNSTAAANLERAKKAVYNMTVELGEKLNPVMTGSTSLFVTMVKVLSVLVSFFLDHYKAIGTITAALVGYNALLIVNNLLTKESIILKKAEVVLSKLKVIWENREIAAMYLKAAALKLVKGEIRAAAAEMAAFNIVTKANPIAMLVAVLAAAGAALYLYSGKLTDAQKAQQALIDVEVEAQKSMVSQKLEMEQLITAARDKTRSDNERAAAIRKLNELSPEYLGFLNLENINTEKATTATNNYIESLLKVARVKAGAAKLQDIEERRIDLNFNGAGTDLWDKVVAGIKSGGQAGAFVREMSDISTKNYIDALKALDAEEKMLKAFIERNQQKSSSKPEQAGGSTFAGPSPDEIKARAKYALEAKSQAEQEKVAHNERLKEVGLFGKKRSELSAADLQTLNDLEKIHREKIASITTKANKKALADQKKSDKEKEELLKSQLAYQSEVIDSQKSEIEQENIAHQERLKKAGIDSKNVRKEQILVFESLEKIHKANLAKIDADAINKEIEKKQKGYEKELSDLRIKNYNELASIKSVDQAKEILKDRLSQKELDKITTLDQAKKALQARHDREELALTQKQGEELIGILEKVLSTGEFEGINLSNKILSPEEKEALIKRLQEVAENVAKARSGNSGTDDQGAGDEKKYSFEGQKGDILGFTQDDWSLFFDHLKNGKLGINEIGMAAQALVGIWGQYSQIVANGERKQLQEFETSTTKKKQLLQQRLDAGKISQKSYNEEVEKLDLALDRKKAEIDRNQAVRERNGALMGAIVNTALGVTKASPNVFLMALVGALGAAQIATILSTPLPDLPGKEEGGYLDVTRSQDNKNFRARNRPNARGYIADPTVLVSENGTEFVANAQAVNNPTIKPMLDILDTAQRNGTINTLNLERMYNAKTRRITGRQNGGYVSDRAGSTGPGSTGSPDNRLMAELLAQQIEINNKLIKRLDEPINAEVVLTGRKGLNAKQAELNSIVKYSSL